MGNVEIKARAGPGPAWLQAVMGRELTDLEAKMAEFFERSYGGIYHLDDSGHAWKRWLAKPNDYTQEITTMAPLGVRDACGAWGDLAAWVEVARDIGLKFALRAAGPHRIGVRFWHAGPALMAAPTRDRSVQERIAQIANRALVNDWRSGLAAAAAIEREIVAPRVAAERERADAERKVIEAALPTGCETCDLVLASPGEPDIAYLCSAHRKLLHEAIAALAAIRATGGA